MPVFAVIRQTDPDQALGRTIAREFPTANFDLGSGVWLVAAPGSAKDISDKLEITPNGVNGTGVVVETASYFGRANPAIWTWIKTQWEGGPHGQ